MWCALFNSRTHSVITSPRLTPAIDPRRIWARTTMENVESPPPGGDVRRGSLILIIGWTECALAMLFLYGRLYTRVRVNHSMGLDDWAMIIAFVSRGRSERSKSRRGRTALTNRI